MNLIFLAAFALVSSNGHSHSVHLTAASSFQTSEAAPFADEIARFEADDAVKPPSKGGVVFVGSSSIRGWRTLKQDFPGVNVINRGFGGSHVSDSVRYVDRIVTKYDPEMVVFFAGTNDIASGKSPEAVFADYQAFVSRVFERLPNAKIAYISISPAPSRWQKVYEIRTANAMIREFCARDRRLRFIDVYSQMLDDNAHPRPELFGSDQLHMNPDGYAIWVRSVAPYLPRHAA